MKRKALLTILPILYIFIILTAFSVGALFFFDLILFCIFGGIAAAAIFFAIFSIIRIEKNVADYFDSVATGITNYKSSALKNFTAPLLITDNTDKIIWFNTAFKVQVAGNGEENIRSTSEIFGIQASEISTDSPINIYYKNKSFSVTSFFPDTDDDIRIWFFSDNTELIKIADRYKKQKTVVLFIALDSVDEIFKNLPDSQKTTILGMIEREIETLTGNNGSFLQKVSGQRYIMITTEEHLHSLIKNEFHILEQVRTLSFGEQGSTTLTIGIGRHADSVVACVDLARQALEMGQSRGGDTAVIKTPDSFEFFGGFTDNKTTTNRVQTRIVAATLKKLIESCDRVFIMGHSFADLDSFGASFALYKTATELGIQSHIVIDEAKNLCTPLIDKIKSMGINGFILPPSKTLSAITKKSLLIIIDTHRANFVECEELYKRAESVAVIDHHRKAADYIENTLLFYHDPLSSSACEMVAELLQYMGTNLVGKIEAEALLAGIMLDTRNYVLRTSTKTFEASAYLRSRGADPVEVKKLFSASIDTYRDRSEIVSQAEIIGNVAISVWEEYSKEIRIASSQAAEELLTISGVSAAFVIFPAEDTTDITARSMGDYNVQIIMEKLGGGGHKTTAAAQLNEPFSDAKTKLLDAIEMYNK